MFTKRCAIRAFTLLVAGLVMVGVTACSDDSTSSSGPPSGIQAIRDAMFAAGSARYNGEVTFAGGSSGPIEGTAAGDPAKGVVRLPVITADGPEQTQLTWVDGILYIERVVGSPPPDGVAVFVRNEADRPWLRVPLEGVAQAVVSPYDPFALLAQLDATSSVLTFREDGSESVGGQELDRSVMESPDEGGTVLPAIQRVELLTDADNRLVIARLIGNQTINYTVSDYGTEVSVTPPAEDQIVVPVVAETGEDPAGDYVKVATGTAEGLVWQLLRAPATNQGACWRLDLQGETDPITGTEADGATCLAAIDPATDEPVQIVASTGSQSSVSGLVAVLPADSRAVLRFADRTSTTLTADPGGYLVWLGPKDPMPVVLDVTLPDGSLEACGPGSVSTLEDLADLPPDQVAALRDAPWLCLPA